MDRISYWSTCTMNYPGAAVSSGEEEQKGSEPCYSSFCKGIWTPDAERSAQTPGLQWEALWGSHSERDGAFLRLLYLTLSSHPHPAQTMSGDWDAFLECTWEFKRDYSHAGDSCQRTARASWPPPQQASRLETWFYHSRWSFTVREFISGNWVFHFWRKIKWVAFESET